MRLIGALTSFFLGLVLLFIVAPYLIITVETNAVCTGYAFDDADANVKTIDNCEYSSSRDGELVHINCQVLHGDHAAILCDTTPCTDAPQWEIHTDGFMLIATTEMWQYKWTERRSGDGSCWLYKADWSSRKEAFKPLPEGQTLCAGEANPSHSGANPTPPLGTILGTRVEYAHALPVGASAADPEAVAFTLSAAQLEKLAVSSDECVDGEDGARRKLIEGTLDGDGLTFGNGGCGARPTSAWGDWAPVGARLMDDLRATGRLDDWKYYGDGEWFYSAGGDADADDTAYAADDLWSEQRAPGDLRLKVVAFGTDYVAAMGKQVAGDAAPAGWGAGALHDYVAGGSDFPDCEPKKIYYSAISTDGQLPSAEDFTEPLKHDLELATLFYRICTFALVLVALGKIWAPIKWVPEVLPALPCCRNFTGWLGNIIGQIAEAGLCCTTCILGSSIWMFLVGLCWVALHPSWGIPLILTSVCCVSGFVTACARFTKCMGRHASGAYDGAYSGMERAAVQMSDAADAFNGGQPLVGQPLMEK